MMKMKCPECSHLMKRISVKIEGADKKAVSYQCGNCGHFEFSKQSASRVVNELKEKEAALKLSQKIIKLSKGRLGIYLNKDVVESLGLKAGEEIRISVPDDKHIVIGLE